MEQKIDLVYLWVDGNDPKWLEKRQKFQKEDTCILGRYQDNQELKYSLRSIEKNMPWVRKIFIVTDNQRPSFINENHPKIQFVNHSEIMPKEILPTFNSVVIEYFIYKIPDLSEKFLLANDDCFVNKKLTPDFFFKEDGLPIVRMRYDAFHKIKLELKIWLNRPVNNYRLSIGNAYRLMEKKFNVFYKGMPHHNLDGYLKSTYREAVEEVFHKELSPIFQHRFREDTDIQRILFNYYSLTIKKGHLKFVNRKESCRFMTTKSANFYHYIKKYDPILFCLNDTEGATDEDRKKVSPFLESLFPEKSTFEK
ncbi:MAG: Stealth CR1 domain-containing protein [Flavobacteriaceae bacterium]|nr:Stealth CR1 domain-containing protein [Flavobacteriaceae bacterium]